jgi:hypothetical protein
MNDRIQRLVNWVSNPAPVAALKEIVPALTQDDLLLCIANISGPAGRIAWAELGRRRGFADFEIRFTELEGQLNLAFEAPAKAIHSEPMFDVKMSHR